MKKYIVLLLILSLSTIGFSQKSTKDYTRIESATKIEGLMYNMEKELNSIHSELISYYYNDTLFFLRADFTTPEILRMYAFSVKTKTYTYQDFDATKLIYPFDGMPYYLDMFAINGKYLVIPGHTGEINGYFLCVYKRVGKEFIYDFEIQIEDDKFSEDMKFLPNGKLLGLKNYLSAGEKKEESSTLTILNLETKKTEKTINLEFLLPLYTLRIPNNILSVNDNSILFSQRGDYKINEYDFDLNPIGTIEAKEIKWDRMPQSVSDSVINNTTQPVERIPFISSNFDKYSSIHNIYSSKNKLFVFYNKKGNYGAIYYDIWEKENGKWTLLIKDISDNPKSIRKKNNQTITTINFARNVHFLGDKFLRINFLIPNLNARFDKIYKEKLEKYILNNEIPYCVESINFKGL